jgi:hypothetical protein
LWNNNMDLWEIYAEVKSRRYNPNTELEAFEETIFEDGMDFPNPADANYKTRYVFEPYHKTFGIRDLKSFLLDPRWLIEILQGNNIIERRARFD